jgi:ATP-dependent Clp protease protease subunit
MRKKYLSGIFNEIQIPNISSRTQNHKSDPLSLLFHQRVIFMGGEVTDYCADAIVGQLLLLDSKDAKRNIKLFVNSVGGSVTAGMGIFDAMSICATDIRTICVGLAASMGAFILGAGTNGKRSSMPNSRIMIHQPLGGASGAAVDIEIQAREIMYHKSNLNRIMAAYTGQPVDKIEEDTDRDRYMSPLEAKEYGIIDHIIGGDDATFRIENAVRSYPATNKDYSAWGNDD